MRYIDSWLSGLGLEYIIPKLKANGITTPKKLAMLTLRDMYEVGERNNIIKCFLFSFYNCIVCFFRCMPTVALTACCSAFPQPLNVLLC
jgi:hypothetical protein